MSRHFYQIRSIASKNRASTGTMRHSSVHAATQPNGLVEPKQTRFLIYRSNQAVGGYIAMTPGSRKNQLVAHSSGQARAPKLDRQRSSSNPLNIYLLSLDALNRSPKTTTAKTFASSTGLLSSVLSGHSKISFRCHKTIRTAFLLLSLHDQR